MSDHSLRLIVPDSTFAGLSVCDTNPAALAEWVGHLPMAHTFEAAHQLLKVATELARISAEPELRFNCLEIIRPPTHYICARLDRTAAGASAAGEGHAQLAQSVQKELVLGYKAVVRDALAVGRTHRFAEGSARQRDAPHRGRSVMHVVADVRVLHRRARRKRGTS